MIVARGFPLALSLALALAGCREGEPRSLTLGFDSYGAAPVVVTFFQINGADTGLVPTVVAGMADDGNPRFASATYGGDYPRGDGGVVRVEARWVELLTSRAYAAEVSAPLDAFDRRDPDTLYIVPVFGPNGLLLVTSDPITDSATDFTLNDVTRACGSRMAEADTDYAADPTALARLQEIMALDFPVVTDPECPDPGG